MQGKKYLKFPFSNLDNHSLSLNQHFLSPKDYKEHSL